MPKLPLLATRFRTSTLLGRGGFGLPERARASHREAPTNAAIGDDELGRSSPREHFEDDHASGHDDVRTSGLEPDDTPSRCEIASRQLLQCSAELAYVEARAVDSLGIVGIDP